MTHPSSGGDPIPAAEFEKHVMTALQFGGLDKRNLAEIVGILSKYNEKGLVPAKVLPIGIPNPDGVWGVFFPGRENIQTLIELLLETPRLQQIKVFPRGIPAIDLYQVELEIR